MIGAVQERIATNARGLLTDAEIEAFETPQAVHEYVNETDDGIVTAVRTQHRFGRDGSGGGFKIVEVRGGMSPDEMLRLNRAHSLGLATLMTLKGGITDLPFKVGGDFGGAKGEMYVPEGTLSSRAKLDAILGDYVLEQASRGVLGVGIDRHAPDMNTGDADMDHMAHVLTELTGDERSKAAFSGKSIEAGGLEGREVATGQGLVYTLTNHLETLGLDPRTTTVAVQGSGNVGYHFARLASEQLGVKILGISDKYKAVVAEPNQPLHIDETITFSNRQIDTWDETRHVTLTNPDDLLDMDVDVFVFAAAPDAITQEKHNKERLRAKHILQGANNPMDADAIDWYIANGKTVVSDIQGNAGGFAASNMEYNQNITNVHWTETMALDALKLVMDEAYEKILAEADGDPHNLVDPAFRVGIKAQYERDKSGLRVPANWVTV